MKFGQVVQNLSTFNSLHYKIKQNRRICKFISFLTLGAKFVIKLKHTLSVVFLLLNKRKHGFIMSVILFIILSYHKFSAFKLIKYISIIFTGKLGTMVAYGRKYSFYAQYVHSELM